MIYNVVDPDSESDQDPWGEGNEEKIPSLL
jgi:hypothetical protein